WAMWAATRRCTASRVAARHRPRDAGRGRCPLPVTRGRGITLAPFVQSAFADGGRVGGSARVRFTMPAPPRDEGGIRRNPDRAVVEGDLLVKAIPNLGGADAEDEAAVVGDVQVEQPDIGVLRLPGLDCRRLADGRLGRVEGEGELAALLGERDEAVRG